MKQLTIWFFTALSLLNAGNDNECLTCEKQDSQYLCAANTLSINSRLCIDLTEVPAHIYKDYLESIAEEFGGESDNFKDAEPDYNLWAEAFPGKSANELKEKFFGSDDLALMPIIGINYEQAVALAAWRTKAMISYLEQLDPSERAAFPKKFKFRLPTENEWTRIRFLIQDKKMLKQLDKIAKNNESSFKLSKSDILNDNAKVKPVFYLAAEDIGFYNVFENVAEMTSTKGVAMGGSWKEPNTGKQFMKSFQYEGASSAVGIRMIFEIIE